MVGFKTRFRVHTRTGFTCLAKVNGFLPKALFLQNFTSTRFQFFPQKMLISVQAMHSKFTFPQCHFLCNQAYNIKFLNCVYWTPPPHTLTHLVLLGILDWYHPVSVHFITWDELLHPISLYLCKWRVDLILTRCILHVGSSVERCSLLAQGVAGSKSGQGLINVIYTKIPDSDITNGHWDSN